jgi:hypothetical protein
MTVNFLSVVCALNVSFVWNSDSRRRRMQKRGRQRRRWPGYKYFINPYTYLKEEQEPGSSPVVVPSASLVGLVARVTRKG